MTEPNHSVGDLESQRLELERRRLESDFAVHLEELRVRRIEADARLADAQARQSESKKRRVDPLVLAIVGGIITLTGNIIVSSVEGFTALQQEQDRHLAALAQESKRQEGNMIIEAIKTGDVCCSGESCLSR